MSMAKIAGLIKSGVRQASSHAPRNPHSERAMSALKAIPHELRQDIEFKCRKVVTRLFAQNLTLVEDDFDKMYTAKPIAKVPHNGNQIRAAYHNALEQAGLKMSQGTFNGILEMEKEHGPAIPAILTHMLREEIRICAWTHMSDQESVGLLRNRNLSKHGRAEGPSIEALIDRYSAEAPDMTAEQLWEKIGGKGFGSTSKEYDRDFGAIPVSIRVGPDGEVESAAQRLARMVEDELNNPKL
ncbi:hypothetical protein [Legionella shakespearei]|uniref:Uncharacterized protein n=1 Tax=Legionella shakespearei DSM 23087 TaxID=1122169 RepID=A0A0W0YRV4_9GAMM|nr:hypothetical protein [Legionella shakespearei]KTD59267.1 hypothetical protein Lsha_1963 [Legionella shakespearei DSM 23087]